jgi:antitoxin MazE
VKTSIIKIGNSRGIRILKAILAKCKITEEVDLLFYDNKMVIQPINKKSRVGWNSKFKSMSDKKQDKQIRYSIVYNILITVNPFRFFKIPVCGFCFI